MENEKLAPRDIYKFVFDTRNFEIGLFWQRSNYFLVLTTALAVGFFNVNDKEYSLLLAVLGLIVSVLWYRVNLGSKFWQSRWEHRLKLVEGQIAPQLELFSADDETIRSDVRESLKSGNRTKFQKLLYRWTLKKPSVSYQMILLSIVFVTGWVLIIAMTLLR